MRMTLESDGPQALRLRRKLLRESLWRAKRDHHLARQAQGVMTLTQALSPVVATSLQRLAKRCDHIQRQINEIEASLLSHTGPP